MELHPSHFHCPDNFFWGVSQAAWKPDDHVTCLVTSAGGDRDKHSYKEHCIHIFIQGAKEWNKDLNMYCPADEKKADISSSGTDFQFMWG